MRRDDLKKHNDYLQEQRINHECTMFTSSILDPGAISPWYLLQKDTRHIRSSRSSRTCCEKFGAESVVIVVCYDGDDLKTISTYNMINQQGHIHRVMYCDRLTCNLAFWVSVDCVTLSESVFKFFVIASAESRPGRALASAKIMVNDKEQGMNRGVRIYLIWTTQLLNV